MTVRLPACLLGKLVGIELMTVLLPLIAAVLFALGLPHGATGHGYIEQPVARNLLSYRAGLQWDPMSLSSGGEGKLANQGRGAGRECGALGRRL